MRNSSEESAVARLCREFVEGGHFPRYLLGRTPPYATSVPDAVDGRLDGVLDEFTKKGDGMGLSVLHSFVDIPRQLFSGRDDSRINLLRCTENLSETDMFFVPEER